jgi:hypothetical protein
MTKEILYHYNKCNEGSITKSHQRREFDICICTNKLLHDLKTEEGLRDPHYLKLLNYKLSREIVHYIRSSGKKQKIYALTPGLKKYLLKNLDPVRKLRFLLLLHRKGIRTGGDSSVWKNSHPGR